ncbi:UNVERIFIED_ORG: nucleoside-diphosphate-sugar epimerase [Methylorubrum zatmanii]|nr:nucleoside-diphosphate-sugar epimerase [Methylorubrum zatmanii]
MNLFVFGLGFSARHFAERERARFNAVRATVTEPERARSLAAETGFTLRAFGPEADDPRIADDLADTDVLLISAPPGRDGDTVLARYRDTIAKSRIGWIGYLSTIGVYGDQGGAWIDETTPATPKSARSRDRLAVENAWLALGAETGKAVQVFRLSGIYGPGRNPIVKLRDGRTQRIVKPGQVFNRIHVADIAATLAASIEHPRGGRGLQRHRRRAGPAADGDRARSKAHRTAPAAGSRFRDRRPQPDGPQLLRREQAGA